MLKEADMFKEEDGKIRARMESRHRLETYVYAARDAINDSGNKLTSEEKVGVLRNRQFVEKYPAGGRVF